MIRLTTKKTATLEPPDMLRVIHTDSAPVSVMEIGSPEHKNIIAEAAS
jgi:hypothetical protein